MKGDQDIQDIIQEDSMNGDQHTVSECDAHLGSLSQADRSYHRPTGELQAPRKVHLWRRSAAVRGRSIRGFALPPRPGNPGCGGWRPLAAEPQRAPALRANINYSPHRCARELPAPRDVHCDIILSI